MLLPRRVRTVFVKELIDIMRDRRTLVALLVVPIVLYPLLMLGAIQALSLQTQQIAAEKLVVGVLSKPQQLWLGALAHEAADIYVRRNPPGRASSAPADQTEWANVELEEHEARNDDLGKMLQEAEVGIVRDLKRAIENRQIQIGIELSEENEDDPATRQLHARLTYDPEEVRSAAAHRRFTSVFGLLRDEKLTHRMLVAGIPLESLRPVVLESQRVTTPGSLLGQILPLILVLMTITGAIYPAIDLTAGERERGTLETLMVCPVPPFELIVGKFMVVTTVALIGAALNLASVSATVFFGGFERIVTGGGEAGFPLARLPLILLTLIPFAVLFSAVMIAVCSYARTFKEAQNYVTPVILAALIPGGIAAVLTPRLEGTVLVVPVANMVLLTRELLLGSVVTLGQVAVVLISTTIYAAAAVGLAARVFGQEAVVFSDSGSLKTALSRRFFVPRPRPSSAIAMLVIALLFPVWFYVQAAAQPEHGEDITALLERTAVLMPICFILLPVAILAYWKIDIRNSLQLRRPRARHVASGILLGVALWVPVHEIGVAIQNLIGIPESIIEMNRMLEAALRTLHPAVSLLILAVIPGLSEELLFRGFLLSGLASSLRKWGAIIVTACIFAAFHFIGIRFPTTLIVGIVLGYVCWQSRSIWPSIIAHVLHNSIALLPLLWPNFLRYMAPGESEHVRPLLLLGAAALIAAGLGLSRRYSHD